MTKIAKRKPAPAKAKKPAKPAKLQTQIVTTRAKLGLELKRSERTVGQYLAAGMPGRPGRYDVNACRDWIALHINSASAEDEEANDQEKKATSSAYRKAKLAKIEEEVREKKLKNDLFEKQIYGRDDVHRELVSWGVHIRSRLITLPKRIAALVPGSVKAEVMKNTDDAVRNLIREAFTAPILDQALEDLILEEAERIYERRAV